MTAYAFDAYVAETLFDDSGQAWFALGDGRIVQAGGPERSVHEGPVLCAAIHATGAGVLSGGDDGAVCLTTPEAARRVAHLPRRWIDALAVSRETGLYAFASGREVHVRDARDERFERIFRHERSVTALAFDPKGRRLAAATYGGVALWWAKIAEQKPQMLKWAGSHIGVLWSPDGRFVVSSMQENALHGWRLSDGKDMRMGGYPAKVKSLAFCSKGRLMASSGAPGAVLWPFSGPDGPMGREAVQVAWREESEVTRIAATPDRPWLAGGRSDGSVWLADVAGTGVRDLAPATGSPIVALALSSDGARVAFGDEAGRAAIVEP